MSASASGLSAAFGEFRGRGLWVALGCLICQMGLGFTYIRTGLSAELVEGLDLTRKEFSSAAMPQLALQSVASPLVGILTVRLGASRVLALASTFFAFVYFGFARITVGENFYFSHVEEAWGVESPFKGSSEHFAGIGALGFSIYANFNFVSS